MNNEMLKFKLLSLCLDDYEPIFILLVEKYDYLAYIEMLVELVNNNFLKCKLDSKMISRLSVKQVIENIEANRTKPSDDSIEFYDWNWQWNKSLLFYGTKKGAQYVVGKNEEAKKRTMELLKKIKEYRRQNPLRIISQEILRSMAGFKPYKDFGKWVYKALDEGSIIGFIEFDDDIDFYGYDTSRMKWDWFCIEDFDGHIFEP